MIAKVCPQCHVEYQAPHRKRKFCSNPCKAKGANLTGSANPNWRGGRSESRPDGYITRYCPEHPRANDGAVLEHWLVAEKALGKYLPPGAVVHHVDENGSNNANANLVICESQGYHAFLHQRMRLKSGDYIRNSKGQIVRSSTKEQSYGISGS